MGFGSVGAEVYRTICVMAERGKRIRRVVLPKKLMDDINEGDRRLFKTLGVDLQTGDVASPEFEV